MVPNLEERIMTGSPEETKLVADLVHLPPKSFTGLH